MRIIFRVVLILFLFSTTVAYSSTSAPAHCPALESITLEGLPHPLVLNLGAQFGKVIFSGADHYGLAQDWSGTFSFFGVEEKDADIIRHANSMLPELKFVSGPTYIATAELWGCSYTFDHYWLILSTANDVSKSISTAAALKMLPHNL